MPSDDGRLFPTESRRRLKALLLFACIALIGTGRILQGTRTGPSAASEYLDLYEHGRYAEFGRELYGVDTVLPFATFAARADAWIHAEGRDVVRRRLVASTVAVEIAHRLRDRPPYVAADFLVWASKRMREEDRGPSDIERLWHLAAIAAMQELDWPWALADGQFAGAPGDLVEHPEAMQPGGQLAIAARRFPAEPRFMLGQLEARESAATIWDSAPPFLAFIRVQASARVVQDSPFREGQNAAFVRNQAADLLERRNRIPGIIEEYRSLDVHEELRPEAALHIGYLEGVQEHWPEALTELRRASELADEPVLRYLSYLFAGRIAQAVGDAAGAVAAFEAADASQPGARSALTLLAAELMLTGGRDEWQHAYVLLQRANQADGPTDPWWFYGRGDAYLWSQHIARLREALR